MGLSSRMKHMPGASGANSNVAIARAIAHSPSVLLPMNRLLSWIQQQAAGCKIFRDLVESEKATIVMTTHDVDL